MRIRLQRYNFKVKYIPGKQIPVADALSRIRVKSNTTEEDESESLELLVAAVLNSKSITRNKLECIKKETATDVDLQLLYRTIVQG